MKKSEGNKENNDFENGMDSGSVPDKTKVNLFAKQLGICAAPDCNNRIHVNKTRLGECAHIIPRKVGSHPREDYKTPLGNRKLDENLLYLCEAHHKFIDNKELAYKYPAKILRQWKADHEKWASQVIKQNAYLPSELKDKLQKAIEQIGEEAEHSNELISKLLKVCHEKILLGKYDEANTLLSQVELLLVGFNDPALIEQSKIIEALLDYRSEDVHLAKKKLLEIIANNTEAYDAMFEYIEICQFAPEPNDDTGKYEQIIQTIYPDHPRLEMLAALRAYLKEDAAKENVKRAVPEFDDDLLELRFLIQKSIVFDVAGDTLSRDKFLEEASRKFPNSPRPHLFRFIFRRADTLRKKPSKEALMSCLSFYEEQKLKSKEKGNLTRRELLSWSYNCLSIKDELFRLFDIDENLIETQKKVIELLLECFADRNFLSILLDVLRVIHFPKKDYHKLLDVLEISKVKKNNELLQQVLLQGIQYEDLYQRIEDFFRNQQYELLSNLVKDMQSRNVENVSKVLNSIGSNEFSLAIINVFPDRKFALDLSSYLEISDEARLEFNFIIVGILAEVGSSEEALKLMASLDVNQLIPMALQKLADISYAHKAWPLFILVGERLLLNLNSEKHKIYLLTQLASVYHKVGDDSKAIECCEKALEKHQDLLPQNVQSLMGICADSHSKMGKPEKAYEVFTRYDIQKNFNLKIITAQYVLKTDRKDKFQIATECVTEGFFCSESYDDLVFVSALEVINEIGKSFEKLGLDTVNVGSYIKLDGIGWLFLGPKEKAMGATFLESGESYDAVLNMPLGSEVHWPPDKFSLPGTTRRIIHILNAIGYLTARAQEGVENLAKLGTEPIWLVQALNEDGSLDVDNITEFFKHQFKNSNQFFEQYVRNVFPFGFLAAVEGGIAKAIGKISNEEKGLIRCNAGTEEDLLRQAKVSGRVLEGAPCVIDGLSAVMLAESGLINIVLKHVPHLSVPISVISYLRKLASDINPASSFEGRGGLVGGSLRYAARSHEREKSLYTKLLEAAEKLDALENKTMGRLVKGNDPRSFLEKFPVSISEPVYIAQDQNACLLTDDHLMLETYKLLEKTDSLEGFSSFSLIKELHSKGSVSLEEYLGFFSLLAGYRYHLLPISVEEIIDAVLPTSASGIMSFQPKNLEYLRLGLTLSESYGVCKTVSIKILSLVFAKLINDDSLTEEVCDTIFSYMIVRYFGQRESYLDSELIKKVVAQKIGNPTLLTSLSKRKYAILHEQLIKFSETYDPIIENIPTLLKVVKS